MEVLLYSLIIKSKNKKLRKFSPEVYKVYPILPAPYGRNLSIESGC
jgi:hypothetical protein